MATVAAIIIPIFWQSPTDDTTLAESLLLEFEAHQNAKQNDSSQLLFTENMTAKTEYCAALESSDVVHGALSNETAQSDSVKDSSVIAEDGLDGPPDHSSQGPSPNSTSVEDSVAPLATKRRGRKARRDSEESSVVSEDAFNRFFNRGPALPSAISAKSRPFEKIVAQRSRIRPAPTTRPKPQPQFSSRSRSTVPAEEYCQVIAQQVRDGRDALRHADLDSGVGEVDSQSRADDESQNDVVWPEGLRHSRPVLRGRNDEVTHSTGSESSSIEDEGGLRSVGYGDHDDSDEGSDDERRVLDAGGDRSEIGRIAAQWVKLKDQRNSIMSTFDNVRIERENLADLRLERDRADSELRMAIMQILPHHRHLIKLFTASEAVALKYQKVETAFDELVDELQDGEIELELEERRFFTAIAQTDNASEVSDEDELSRTDSPTYPDELRGIQGNRPEDVHPLFEELLESFRELQLAKEFQLNIAIKKRMIELKWAKDPAQDDIEFLEEYDTFQIRAQTEIEEWTKTAQQLEKECREKRIIPKNTLFQQERFGFDPVFRDDIYLEEDDAGQRLSRPSGRNLIAHSEFSLILSNPSHLLDTFPKTAEQFLQMAASLPSNLPLKEKLLADAQKEIGIQSLLTSPPAGLASQDIPVRLGTSPRQIQSLFTDVHKDDGSKPRFRDERDTQSLLTDLRNERGSQTLLTGRALQDREGVSWDQKEDFINRWLLHKLRLSKMEAVLLSTTFRSYLKVLDVERWQRDVLFFWTRDAAAHQPEKRQVEGTYGNLSLAVTNSRTSRATQSEITDTDFTVIDI